MDEKQQTDGLAPANPGDIISPQDPSILSVSHDSDSPPLHPAQSEHSKPEQSEPEPPKPDSMVEPKSDDPQNPPQNQQWQHQSGQLNPNTGYGRQPEPEQLQESESISWDASEFMPHEKGGSWYLLLAIIIIALAAAIYFLTKDIFSVVVVGLVAVVLGFMAGIKPRVLSYTIGPKGIQVGNKHFGFETFRSFSVLDDPALPSIQLLPQKRFMVPVILYFGPQDANKIVEILGNYLPFEHRERDFIDKITAKFRF